MRSDIIKRYIIPSLVLALVIWGIFRWLGGGREHIFSIRELPDMNLYGHMYEGRPGSPELEKYFFEVRDQSSFREGHYLTLVSFGTSNTVDTLRQFIGTENSDVPDNFENYTLPAASYVEVVLDMHAMVRPSPGRIREEAETFAEQKGLQIAGWNLEVFTAEDELTVLFPVMKD